MKHCIVDDHTGALPHSRGIAGSQKRKYTKFSAAGRFCTTGHGDFCIYFSAISALRSLAGAAHPGSSTVRLCTALHARLVVFGSYRIFSDSVHLHFLYYNKL